MEQLAALKKYLKEKGTLAVAFSGGVDSTFLLAVAHEVLGDAVLAVTARAVSFPEREHKEAEEFCKSRGIRQIIVEVDQLRVPGFAENPTDRCYICKKAMFEKIFAAAKENGIACVAEASNMDDNGDYRPGMRAVAELGVISPLREAGLYKKTIRELSQEMGLLTWDKPSFACLSTRFPYGEEITAEKLAMIDAAEQYLIDAGFSQVRVRLHENGGGSGMENESLAAGRSRIARIEMEPCDFPKLFTDGLAEKVNARLKEIGFSYVALDLGGYRTGSMNDGLQRK